MSNCPPRNEVEKNQTEVVLRTLKLQKKVLTGDDSPLAAAYVKARSWNHKDLRLGTPRATPGGYRPAMAPVGRGRTRRKRRRDRAESGTLPSGEGWRCAPDLRIALRYNAEFDEDQSLSMTAALDDKLYKRLRQVTDALAREAGKFHMSVCVTARYDTGLAIDGDAFRILHDLCATAGLGRIRLDAEPVATGDPA